MWQYDDDTFSDDLMKLLDYTKEGNLQGCIYYVNAAYILERFKEITNLSEDNLKENIQCGIDLYFSKNKIETDERLHLEHTFNPDNWPVNYIIKKIDKQNYIYSNENIDQLLFTRHLSKKIRNSGQRTKGPKKRTKDDDIKFEKNLISLIEKLIY